MTIQKKILKQLKHNQPLVTYIWAEDLNQGIGIEGRLPWYLPEELKYFKDVTWNDTVMMGRKTYESIPKRPLSNRLNLVLTHQSDYKDEGAHVFQSADDMLKKALSYDQPIHIIGGASLYKLYQPKVNLLYRTVVESEFEVDTWFPHINYADFKLIDLQTNTGNPTHQLSYRYEIWARRDLLKNSVTSADGLETAILAGGCFWCLVEPFDQKPGIKSVVSGYTGGHKKNPTYEDVISGLTGHKEAVEIVYDPSVISFSDILETYWQLIDYSDNQGQFMDRGDSYQPVIYYTNETQKQQALRSKQQLIQSKKEPVKVVVPIKEAINFYPAEEYHQNFYLKNNERYQAHLASKKAWLKQHGTKT